MFFTPGTAELIEAELLLEFLDASVGSRMFIALAGVGENVDVALSTPSLTLEPSFISLLSQASFRIRNMGSNPIKFIWKSYANAYDEEGERERLLYEINRMETLERNALRDRIASGVYGKTESMDAVGSNSMLLRDTDSGPGPQEDENVDGNYGMLDGANLPYRARADEAVLQRKYRNLRLALENDPMQFVDDIFEISPLEGSDKHHLSHTYSHTHIVTHVQHFFTRKLLLILFTHPVIPFHTVLTTT